MKHFTKFAGLAVGLVLLGSALVPVAQASSLNSTQISAILSLLEAFGASPSVISNVELALGGSATVSTTPISSSCSQFANLSRGETDATTGGAVSQLQQFLGIYPTTGYYGPLTGIGYTNKCIGGNSQPTSVAGMSQYTDSSFGFSFWYPSGWTVTTNYTKPSSCWGGGTFVKSLVVSGNNKSITLNEVTSPSGVIYGCGVAYDQYYFDSTAGVWMYTPKWATYAEGTPGTPQAADVSQNTMGGLHIFGGEVVPLSADNFVIGDANDTTGISGSEPAAALLNTIVATNPTVATPVSTAQQTATIQAEASAYGVSSVSNPLSSMQTYTNSQYGFSVQYPNGVQINTTPTAQQSYTANINAGTIVATIGPVNGSFTATEAGWGDNGVVTTSGKVTISVSTDPTDVAHCMTAPSGSEEGGTNIVNTNINGINFLSYDVDELAAGLFGSDHTYTTLRNGTCYSIDESIQGGESGHMNTADAASNNAVIAQVNSELDSIAQSFLTFTH